MKVLLINKFHYYKGGSETYYFGLADLLKKKGHDVIFFSMKDERNVKCEQEPFFVENVDFNKKMNTLDMAKAGMKMLYSLEAKKKLEQLIEKEKPDIAHLNIFQSQLTGSVVDVLYKHHIPMVYTTHDMKTVCPTYLFMCDGKICHDCVHGNYTSCIKKKCMKNSTAKSILAVAEAEVYRLKKTYDKINLMISPSDHHKRYIEESKITTTPVRVLRNFLPENVKITNEVKPGSYFLYFGRISVEKGIMTLIRAYALSNQNTPLYIVGTGPLEKEVIDEFIRYKLNEKIRLLGFKRGQELTQIVEGAKCVILPSECCENAPYSILESMAVARPVIVSRNGGLPEIVEEGKNGFISEPNNPEDLARLLDKMDSLSEEQLIEMGTHSINKVKEIADADKYVEEIEKIYNEFVI
ncbi:MAG: glycosyltransferase family 4 protein [Bacillota bacterium]|nr:glycosyltransferase family 4 protein [Bacillota bacterium]